jgi:hypothetical protein
MRMKWKRTRSCMTIFCNLVFPSPLFPAPADHNSFRRVSVIGYYERHRNQERTIDSINVFLKNHLVPFPLHSSHSNVDVDLFLRK